MALAGLVETGQKLASKELSPVELTEAMFERIDELDPKLMSYATLMKDQALAEAKTAESEIASGNVRGPLHGVPIAVKDLCDATGVPTMAGIPAFKDRVAGSDSTVVRRLREAGAVVLGKLQLTEGALALHHPDVPPPVNPWKADLWCGASSSGSGSATAAGLCFGSLGSDTGGSIRFPSYTHHIVGLKPTWGRVSRHGVFPLSDTLDHVGPMTRRVEDAAAMLGAIAGRDENDPTSLAGNAPDYLATINAGVSGLRVGFDEQYCSEGVDAAVAKSIRRGLDILKARGAEIVPVSMPKWREAVELWIVLCSAEAAVAHEATYPQRGNDYSEAYRGFLDAGMAVTGVDYAKATIARREFAGGYAMLFEAVDLLIAPIMATPVPTTDEFLKVTELADGVTRIVTYTSPQDLTGSPAIILPGGLDDTGAPVGFQLVGRHLQEDKLFEAGMAYQADAGWPNQPPLAV
ncbi:MAG: amidase [Alphaproteobacteria bacterium]